MELMDRGTLAAAVRTGAFNMPVSNIDAVSNYYHETLLDVKALFHAV
jgi:hypothetical protein